MFILPMSGLSEVMGMMTCTVLRKMVMERRMVTPADIIDHADKENIFVLTDCGRVQMKSIRNIFC